MEREHDDLDVDKVAQLARASLGPSGRSKLIVQPSGDLSVSNDGRHWLSQLQVQHPLARLLVQHAEAQDVSCGDGTTSVVALAASVYQHALRLVQQGMPAAAVAAEIELAAARAMQLVDQCTVPASSAQTALLADVARVALGTKVPANRHDEVARVCVDAAAYVPDVRCVTVHTLSAADGPCELIRGVVLAGKIVQAAPLPPPSDTSSASCRVAVLSFPIDVPRTKTRGETLVQGASDVQRLRQLRQASIDRVVMCLQRLHVRLVITQWGLDRAALDALAAASISLVTHVSARDLDRVAMATGALISPRLDFVTDDAIGTLSRIDAIADPDTPLLILRAEAARPTAALLVRASSQSIAAEIAVGINDALLCLSLVRSDARVVAGGGACDLAVHRALCRQLPQAGTRAHAVWQCFADALLAIPQALAAIAGLDSIRVVATLAADADSTPYIGVGGDMLAQRVVEPARVKESMYLLAGAFAATALRVDRVVTL